MLKPLLDGIPHEFRETFDWCLYTNEKRPTWCGHPANWHRQNAYLLKHSLPENHHRFHELLVHGFDDTKSRDGRTLAGPTAIIQRNCGIIAFDLDREVSEEEFVIRGKGFTLASDYPVWLAWRNYIRSLVMTLFPDGWCEYSSSGRGEHLFIPATADNESRHTVKLLGLMHFPKNARVKRQHLPDVGQVIIGGLVHMTGHRFTEFDIRSAHKAAFPDAPWGGTFQERFDWLLSRFDHSAADVPASDAARPAKRVAQATVPVMHSTDGIKMPPVSTDKGRRTDYSPEGLIQRLGIVFPHSYGFLDSVGSDGGNNGAFFGVVCDLFKLCGDPMTVVRAIRLTTFYRQGTPPSTGGTRAAKIERLFRDTLLLKAREATDEQDDPLKFASRFGRKLIKSENKAIRDAEFAARNARNGERWLEQQRLIAAGVLTYPEPEKYD